MTPTVSVILPVRNGEAYLRHAIDSVLTQSAPISELLVIDDGSTDATGAILEEVARDEPRVRVIEGAGRGPGPARNRALDQAKGDIIGFIDSDDLWPEGKLGAQISRLGRAPKVDIVSGFVGYFRQQHPDALKPADGDMFAEIFHVNLGAAIFRRSVFDAIGQFDETFLYSEDVDLILRARDTKIPMTILPIVTLYYRQHAASMTAVHTESEGRDFKRAMWNSMKRRRARPNETLASFEDLVERVTEPC